MRGHARKLERTNHGCYFSECGCGWSGGVYRDRAAAIDAHAAHTRGEVCLIGKMGTTLLIGPRARGMGDKA